MQFISAILFSSLAILFISCQNKFPLDTDLAKDNYELYNQDSAKVNFPGFIKGKITVMGFIYTHCPDICPMTTHNMVLTEEKLKADGIDDVNFVILTFDPNRDTPSVLKKYAEIRGIDFKNWTMLWGNKKNTDALLKRFDILAIPQDSTYSEDGELSYFITHTDRISLIDRDAHLRKNYPGSRVNLNELIPDIKDLGDY